ncbi:putative ABC transporter [Trypanosoma grayi]|uniref:putative ABC transporter n=1 Tax=Trypanosoma grayi TaxID=71804 RepID=UPI0004F469CF|nr:putative ABC transporter [Trypanosoma grayi]KEG09643.1 putative ABC transporter [Trypanosoma grayi]
MGSESLGHSLSEIMSNYNNSSLSSRSNTESKSESMKSVPMASHSSPTLFSQTLAVLQRDILERRRAWCSSLLELLVPLICIGCSVILSFIFGEASESERIFVDYTSPAPNSGAFDYRVKFCYDDTILGLDGEPNVIPGISSCSALNRSVDCTGDESTIPVRGLCTIPPFVPFVEFVESSLGSLNVIPDLDNILLCHWNAAKQARGGSSDNGMLNNAGVSFTTHYTAVSTVGSVYIGPSDKVPSALLSYFNSVSTLFRYVYAGTYTTTDDLKDAVAKGEVFAIININSMTNAKFDVDIQMHQDAFPLFNGIVTVNYPGGLQSETSEMYLVSGFLTLQRILYDYYLESVVSASAVRRYFVPYVMSMGYGPYRVSKMLEASGRLVAFIIVLGFLYPVVQMARRRVLEKELRIREAVQIMGLKNISMNISWFIICIMFMFVSSILCAALLQFYLARTEYIVVFFVIFMFALTTIPFAGLIAAFFSKSRFASMMAPLIYSAAAAPISATWAVSASANTVFCLLPPTAFSVALGILFNHEVGGGFGPRDFNNPLDGPNMTSVLLMLTADFFLYLLLMLYMEAVLPREWGTPEHPLFFIIKPWRHFSGQKSDIEGGPDGRAMSGVFEGDYRDDEERVSAVKLLGLRQEFKRNGHPFVAVNNLYWELPENSISVLLGHNGAGKTTTVNMITGLTKPDAGDCLVYGLSVREELERVRQEIALCPQHNILWPTLTCREHLEFFARIKGLKGAELEDAVQCMLREVGLYDKRDTQSAALSGGQKRKLSVAVAFVGGSRFVLLDEPTAGMDVAARRQTWQLLQRMSERHTILLTTHFMDEADILGDQVAMMNRGSLQCCGSSLFLKSRLGTGYKITMSLRTDANRKEIEGIIVRFASDAKYASSNPVELTYHLPVCQAYDFVPLLTCLEMVSGEVGIRFFTLSASTLEDVFLRIVAENEGEAQMHDAENKELLWQCGRVEWKWGLVSMQSFAMMKKRLSCARRDWQMLSFQIACPVLCVLLAVLLDLMREVPPSSMELSPAVYPFDTMSDTTGCAPFFDTMNFTPANSTTRVHMRDLNMVDSMDMSYYHVDNQLANAFPHYTSFSCNDPEYESMLGTKPIVMFYNTSAPHESAIALSTLYSMIVQTAKGRVAASMRTTAKWLSSTQVHEPMDDIRTILKGVIIMIPFSILPSNCVAWVVKERECGARRLQNIAGLRFRVYWIMNFLFDMAAYIVTMLLVIVILAIFNQKEYASSNTVGPTFVLLFIFGLTGTVMAYALSFGFKTHTAAQTLVMIVGFCFGFLLVNTVFLLTLMDSTRGVSNKLRWVFRFFPTYAVGEGIINLATLPLEQYTDPGRTAWSMKVVGWPCVFMAIEFPFFVLFTLLMDHPVLRMLLRRRGYSPLSYSTTVLQEDSDVEEERDCIYTRFEGGSETDAVTLLDMRKVYSNGKVAVQRLAFGVVKGEVFGFLGTNGAGKTTTMSVLCQDTLPTSGRAFICGYDVVEQSEEARACIGYCPQFDACLDLLTVEEHLQLYASVHGIVAEEHDAVVETLLNLCGVSEYRTTLSSELSGGNRRKLSLAVALLGGPRVLLLDEPTAGMDPVARRSAWMSIARVSKFCSVLLTTHHLEEVEHLASCVAIMVDGALHCIGDKSHLKDKYGSGYELSLRISNNSCYNGVRVLMEEQFPEAVLNEYRSLRFVYALPKETLLSSVFAVLQGHGSAAGITDYSVTETSIEQVFMRISEEAGLD